MYVICKSSPKHKQRQGFHTLTNIIQSNNTHNTTLLNNNSFKTLSSSIHNDTQSNIQQQHQHRTVTRYVHTHPQPRIHNEFDSNVYNPYNKSSLLYNTVNTVVNIARNLVHNTKQQSNTLYSHLTRYLQKYKH